MASAESVAQAATHPRLMTALESLPAVMRDRFGGFSGWSIEELQRQTGLEADDARRAGRRDFSEPGLWSGDEESKAEFVAALEALGIVAQHGGRFLTLSFGGNKGDRLREIVARYREGFDNEIVSVALGDAPNDIGMLEAADLGIIIPNPAHAGIGALAGEAQGRVRRAVLPGPAGWNASLLALLNEPGFTGSRGSNV